MLRVNIIGTRTMRAAIFRNGEIVADTLPEPTPGQGQVLVKTLRSTGEGLTATGIPFGTYEVTASLDGQPLQVKLWSPDAPPEFGPSVTHDFTMGWLHNQMLVAAQP